VSVRRSPTWGCGEDHQCPGRVFAGESRTRRQRNITHLRIRTGTNGQKMALDVLLAQVSGRCGVGAYYVPICMIEQKQNHFFAHLAHYLEK